MSEDEGYIARELRKYSRKEKRALRFFITILTGMIGIGAAAAIFAPGSSVYPGYGLDTMEGIFKVVVAGMILLVCIGLPQFWFMGGDEAAQQPTTYTPPITWTEGGNFGGGGDSPGPSGGVETSEEGTPPRTVERKREPDIPNADDYILVDDKND